MQRKTRSILYAAFGIAAAGLVASGVANVLAPPPGPADCPEIGDMCDDGTVYVGSASEGNAYLFARPVDDSGFNGLEWETANSPYYTVREKHGYDDWRLPTDDELHTLYKNRNKGALNGSFEEDIWAGNEAVYWSSTTDSRRPRKAMVERFNDVSSKRFGAWKRGLHLSARYVRSVPRP